MGTILERLVPCMSGSSKRTLRMPRSFQPASTCSTETDFRSAIAMVCTPASVVPGPDVQPEGGHQGHDRIRLLSGDDGQHTALAAIPPQECVGQHPRRLEVTAVHAQDGIRVMTDGERAPAAADTHDERRDVADAV